MPTAQPPYPRAVYIVEQHPGGQSSTIYISRGVNRNAETQNKTGTQFTTTSTQPGQINGAALERENPVKTRYDQLTKGQIGIWIAAAVVLSLAAAVISKHPERTVLSACSVNIAVAVTHLFLPIGPAARPIAPNNARPSNRFLIVLSISTLTWIAGMSLMFAVLRFDGDHYGIFDPKRHVVRAGRISFAGKFALQENLAIACGCMGGAAVLCCLIEFYVIFRICSSRFEAADIRKVFAS